MRILLIEDDLKLAKLISTYLTRQHHLVEQTSDGDQGLDWLLQRMYDVAIIDWMLPQRSGGYTGVACHTRHWYGSLAQQSIYPSR